MGKRYEDWKPGDIVICLKDDSAWAPVKRGQRLTLKSTLFNDLYGMYFEVLSDKDITWLVFALDLIKDNKLARALYGL